IPADADIVGLLPGSRRAELRSVAPTLFAAVKRVTECDASRQVVCMVAPSVAAEVESLAGQHPGKVILVRNEAEKADAFASMKVAIACSGTVTTELAAQGAAVVTGYKLGWITWALLRGIMFKARFTSLINNAVDREVIPEFIQTRFKDKLIGDAAELRLTDASVLQSQL